MRNYLIVALSILLIAGVAGISLPSALCQEEEGVVVVNDFSGEITSVDQEKSMIVIKQLKDEKNQIYDEVAVYIDDSTTIEKGYETVSLSSLTTGDLVDIEYTTSDEGKKIATYIWIKTE